MNQRNPLLSSMVCLVFFLSGASALIFETLWFRLAGLTFGNSVWASVLVLSSFMSGLALGNGLTAFWPQRIRNPLRFYAFVEIVVGVCGVSLVLLFPVLTEWLAPLFRHFLAQPFILNPLRLGLSFVLMLVPATAMGMTLPLVVKALRLRYPSYGRVLGTLYGLNTLGAVAGALSGEMLLIGPLGIRGTGVAACILNVVCALTVLAAYRLQPAEPLRPQSTEDTTKTIISVTALRMLCAGFLSGGILLGLEVIWFRFLCLFVNGHTLAFAMMLATVLSGIGLGGIIASVCFRLHPTAHRYAPVVALAGGIVSLLAYRSFGFLAAPSSDYFSEWSNTLYYAVPLALPVSIASGILFPMIGERIHEEIHESLKATGLLTLANTVGATLGSALVGFVMLPGVGMEKSLFALSFSYVGVAALLHQRVPSGRTRSEKNATYAAVALFCATVGMFPFGVMREHIVAVGERLCRSQPGWYLAAFKEGLNETSQYWQRRILAKAVNTRLFTNNHSMSSTELVGKRYMNMFVYLPIAMNPHAKDALLICFGVGSTARALTDSAGLKSIDVVDISRDILKGAEIIFHDDGKDPLRDPRLSVHVEDGRFFLQTTERQFDLITAEPPPPWLAGVVNLYSREYFQLIYNRLREGGIATYWLPVAQLRESGAKAVLKAFCSVFPDCTLWTGIGLEWVMVGTKGTPHRVTEDDFSRQWRDPLVAPMLRRCGWETPEQLGAAFLMDASYIQRWVAQSRPVVDNNPRRIFGNKAEQLHADPDALEYVMDVRKAAERFDESSFIRDVWPEALRRRTLQQFPFQEYLNDAFLHPLSKDTDSFWDALHDLLTGSSLRFPVLCMIGGQDAVEADLVLAPSDVQTSNATPAVLSYAAAQAMANRDYGSAERYFALSAVGNSDPSPVFYRVYCLSLLGRLDEARALTRDKMEFFKTKPGKVFVAWLSQKFPAIRLGSSK